MRCEVRGGRVGTSGGKGWWFEGLGRRAVVNEHCLFPSKPFAISMNCARHRKPTKREPSQQLKCLSLRSNATIPKSHPAGPKTELYENTTPSLERLHDGRLPKKQRTMGETFNKCPLLDYTSYVATEKSRMCRSTNSLKDEISIIPRFKRL